MKGGFLGKFLDSIKVRIDVSKKVALLFANYLADMSLYLRHSATLSPCGKRASQQAVLTKHYHAIEKGLCLANGRVGFSASHIEALSSGLPDYLKKYGTDDVVLTTLRTLGEYHKYGAERGHDDEELSRMITDFRLQVSEAELQAFEGGAKATTRQEIHASSQIDFASFARTRHSVRKFSDEPVEQSLLYKAIEIAQMSPSACNRQASRVHIVSAPDRIGAVLKHQMGNRGFGDSAAAILILTSEIGAFIGTRERNQAYIDGGMFAMSLVYALHSLGLGTCCLNLSLQFYEAKRLRREVHLPASEALIMMIAVGNLPESFLVTCSHRRSGAEVTTMH